MRKARGPILLVDNYDSFTYNLYQYLRELGAKVIVRRNDAVDAGSARRLKPAGIVLSPGPGRPSGAGACLELIRELAPEGVPILGVCLGHQAIGEAFGGKVVRAPRLMHGKTSPVRHDGTGVFAGLPRPLEAARYHSLCVEPRSLPKALRVTARAADGTIMGLRHRRYPVEGVQFHPESFATSSGVGILRNFLVCARHKPRGAA